MLLRSSMSIPVFSARLIAEQVAMFLGYSLGLNGKCEANAPVDRETVDKPNANNARTETMTQGRIVLGTVRCLACCRCASICNRKDCARLEGRQTWWLKVPSVFRPVTITSPVPTRPHNQRVFISCV